MRAVVQRSSLKAEVKVENNIVGTIPKGLIVYLGIEDNDEEEDIVWLSNKILNLRIFNDQKGKMNFSVLDINGGVLVISQFTLFASTKKGNRPSYLRSAKPEFANELYEKFVTYLRSKELCQIATGSFGKDMKVSYTNDGPVTIIIDTKNKE